MAYVYARIGPPFNFQGTFSESQWAAFKAWVQARLTSFVAVQQHHQIRAQQLRKTAGLLEKFYSSQSTPLAPTFTKAAWSPAPTGHFPFAGPDDHTPSTLVNRIKEHVQPALEYQDEAVFHMNHVRTQIERQEDAAQYAFEGSDDVTTLIQRIETLFDQPEYQAALVKDLSDLFRGEPRFRVHPLDAPTAWELQQRQHATL